MAKFRAAGVMETPGAGGGDSLATNPSALLAPMTLSVVWNAPAVTGKLPEVFPVIYTFAGEAPSRARE